MVRRDVAARKIARAAAWLDQAEALLAKAACSTRCCPEDAHLTATMSPIGAAALKGCGTDISTTLYLTTRKP